MKEDAIAWGNLGLHQMETEQSAEAIAVRGYELSEKAEEEPDSIGH